MMLSIRILQQMSWGVHTLLCRKATCYSARAEASGFAPRHIRSIVQKLKRVLSLYLQSPKVRSVCGRTVSTELPAASLERQGSLLLFHLVEPKQLFFQVSKATRMGNFVTRAAGHGAPEWRNSCHVTVEGLRLYPELHGESTFTAQNPLLYSPSLPEIASPEELKILSEITEIQANSLTHALATHRSEMDLNSLLRMYAPKVRSVQTPAWHTPALITASVVSSLTIIGLLSRLFFYPRGSIGASTAPDRTRLEPRTARQRNLELRTLPLST
jgi:hypothetical protein